MNLIALETQKEHIKSLLNDLSKKKYVRGSDEYKKFVQMQSTLRQHVFDLNNRIIEARTKVIE